MADVTKLATYLNAYGIAVRAGVVTPCVEDEVYLRDMFGLPPMPESVEQDWTKTGGIRRPITLVQDQPPTATGDSALQDAQG